MSTNYINKITDTGGTTHDIAEGVDTRIFRATCSTAANTAAKVATLDDATGYSLAAGVRVAVTFTYGNSAATPTLNVNSGGAKNITVPTSVTALTSGNGTTYNTWGPHETVIFTYSGSYWVSGGSSRSIYNAYVSNAHAHGNITSGGDITATAPTIANGDQLIINDHSASKITNGPTFDGSTTTTALTPKGTWETFSKFSGSYNDLSNKPTIPTVPTNVSAFTNDAGYITSADIPEGSAASTTTPKMDGTAAIGTELAFARGDHVHPSDTSRVPTSRTINGKALSSNITLSASDVGALPSSTVIPDPTTVTQTLTSGTEIGSVNGTKLYAPSEPFYTDGSAQGKLLGFTKHTYSGISGVLLYESVDSEGVFIPDGAGFNTGSQAIISQIPTATSQLTNDSGFITSAPVTSVNTKTGAVVLSASDISALALTGGTLSGKLTITGSSSTDNKDLLEINHGSIHVKESSTDPYSISIDNTIYRPALYIDSNGRGLYDSSGSSSAASGTQSWIIYMDTSDNVKIPHELRVDGASIRAYQKSGQTNAITNEVISPSHRIGFAINGSDSNTRGIYDWSNGSSGSGNKGLGDWVLQLNVSNQISMPNLYIGGDQVKPLKHYDETSSTNYTISSNNYVAITRPSAISGKTIVAITVLAWSSNTGAFWVMPYSASNTSNPYIVGASGVKVNGLKLRYWYVD